jgi:hypothetical protein
MGVGRPIISEPSAKTLYMRGWRARNPEAAKEQAAQGHRAWTDRNPGENARRANAWCAANKSRHKDTMMRRKYGITLAEYDLMLARQCGVCAFCGDSIERNAAPRAPLSGTIDHDHDTGKIRGIVHAQCNGHRIGINDLNSAHRLVTYFEAR